MGRNATRIRRSKIQVRTVASCQKLLLPQLAAINHTLMRESDPGTSSAGNLNEQLSHALRAGAGQLSIGYGDDHNKAESAPHGFSRKACRRLFRAYPALHRAWTQRLVDSRFAQFGYGPLGNQALVRLLTL